MSNLYAAPAADMASPLANNPTYLPRMFQLNGRIGRVRYIVYATVLSFIMFGAMGVVLGLLAATGSMMMVVAVAVLMWIPMFVFLYFVLRRRLHDLGKSGWFGLLQFIPIVNLFFILWLLFARGNEGTNEYGPAPAPNTRALVITAWLIPIAMIAATPSYLKFENELVKKMGGSSTSATDFQAQMEAAAAAAEAKADAIEGVGNQTGTEAGKEEAAPAEPKPAN